MTLKDKAYAERLVGQEVTIMYLHQKVLRVKFIPEIDRWVILTDRMEYVFTPEEFSDQLKDIRKENNSIAYSALNKAQALKKAELITDLIISSSQMGANVYSRKKLNKVINLLKQVL